MLGGSATLNLVKRFRDREKEGFAGRSSSWKGSRRDDEKFFGSFKMLKASHTKKKRKTHFFAGAHLREEGVGSSGETFSANQRVSHNRSHRGGLLERAEGKAVRVTGLRLRAVTVMKITGISSEESLLIGTESNAKIERLGRKDVVV